MAGVPGILAGDNDPYSSTVLAQNIGPAGDSAALRQPSPSWPFANVIPELNNIWLKPGMALEPGTGFSAKLANAAQTSAPFGFPFFLPSITFNPGRYPTMPPGPTEVQEAQTGLGGFKLPGGTPGPYKLPPDLQREIDDANQSIESFKNYHPMSDDSVRSQIDQTFGNGPEPKFNLSGEENGNPFLPDSFHLTEPVSPAVRAAQSLDPFTLKTTWPTEADLSSPTRWADTGFNLTNPSGEEALNPNDFNLGSGGAGGGWTGPVGAAGAAIPMVTQMITKDPRINAAAQGVGTGLTVASTVGSAVGEGAAEAAAATGLEGLAGTFGPGVGVAMLPLVLGRLYDTIQHTFPGLNLPGSNKRPPTGFVPIPGNGSMFGNPLTGEIIQRDGRFGFKYSDQTNQGNAITPEQARQWGMPIPGVDIPEDTLRTTNPWLYSKISGTQDQVLSAGPNGIAQGPGRTPGQSFSVNDIRNWTTPGWRAWDSDISNLQKANPEMAPGEVWRQWTASPNGQAFMYNQSLQQLANRNDR